MRSGRVRTERGEEADWAVDTWAGVGAEVGGGVTDQSGLGGQLRALCAGHAQAAHPTHPVKTLNKGAPPRGTIGDPWNSR
jgi:hypothetical protein